MQSLYDFTVISPEQFKQILWKNGKGTTTELAINEGGTVDDFEWRLSIASVVENGDFSDFSGYWRNLVLISGNGIYLKHQQNKQLQQHKLTQQLQIASFDGGCKTTGELINGNICDFNIMTRLGAFSAEIATYDQQQTARLNLADITFIYPLEQAIVIDTNQVEVNEQVENKIKVPAKHLLKITPVAVQAKQVAINNEITAFGEKMIVICLHKN
jgi:hypothetical protein